MSLRKIVCLTQVCLMKKLDSPDKRKSRETTVKIKNKNAITAIILNAG